MQKQIRRFGTQSHFCGCLVKPNGEELAEVFQLFNDKESEMNRIRVLLSDRI